MIKTPLMMYQLGLAIELRFSCIRFIKMRVITKVLGMLQPWNKLPVKIPERHKVKRIRRIFLQNYLKCRKLLSQRLRKLVIYHQCLLLSKNYTKAVVLDSNYHRRLSIKQIIKNWSLMYKLKLLRNTSNMLRGTLLITILKEI